MKPLFEYLIAKENKDKIAVTVTTGDIILYSTNDYYIYLDYDTCEIAFRKSPIETWWNSWKKHLTNGVFIYYDKKGSHSIPLGYFDDKLHNITTQKYVKSLFRGEVPKDLIQKGDITCFGREFLKEEAKKRKETKLK